MRVLARMWDEPDDSAWQRGLTAGAAGAALAAIGRAAHLGGVVAAGMAVAGVCAAYLVWNLLVRVRKAV